MKKAERKMDPVLVAFRDQVLFLKHNLNAKAIASLETQASGIQSDVDALVRDRIASIEQVAGDLFEEWEGEIAQISRADLRHQSNALLTATRARFKFASRLVLSSKP